MVQLVNIADIVNQETGKTFRQENKEKVHNIPVGSLVEIKPFDSEYDGIRLYVIGHHRDCDETPLYALGTKDAKMYDNGRYFPNTKKDMFHNPETIHGFSEKSLIVIRLFN